MAEPQAEQESILSMSDEDFSNLSDAELFALEAGEPLPVAPVVEEEEEEDPEPLAAEPDALADEGTKEGDEGGPTPSAEEGLAEGGEPNPLAPENETPEKIPDAAEKAEELDYKALYEQITAPFRANGKDMQVKSADEAIQLMQMGANYNKKMGGLKPNLKLMKLLEKNELLSEEKISFLIDVNKRDPKAIAKLLKDGDIDPMDLRNDEESTYEPKTYTVDDAELALDQVVDEMRDSPTFTQTLEVVTNKWDGPSKQELASKPQLLKWLDGHMASGIYDTISQEVERERMFGRFEGVSDFEAYRVTGDKLNEQGAFAQPSKPPAAKQPAQKPSSVPDANLNNQRRAASPTKATAPTKRVEDDFNPLALSDEEFEKRFPNL